VKSALTQDPGINYVIPIYDSMAFFAVPAITEAGKQGSVKVATYNGTPDVLKFLQANNVVDMEVGENLDWLAHANMDAAFRILSGQKVPTKLDERTPLRVFDATNVAQAGKPPKFSVGYGNAYTVGYAKLWGDAK
jgi:ribose transport system substrate-binding protein